MKIEYKSIPIYDIKNLNDYGKDGWITSIVVKDIIILYREIKISRSQKKAERTEEYQKFHDLYPKKSGITSDSVIRKIGESVNNGTYKLVMEGVERYLKMIKVENIVPKFILNAETFLNQRRWEDPFEVFENIIPISENWLFPILKDLNELEIKEAMRIKKEWEKSQKKDCTPGVFENIIKRVKGEEI